MTSAPDPARGLGRTIQVGRGQLGVDFFLPMSGLGAKCSRALALISQVGLGGFDRGSPYQRPYGHTIKDNTTIFKPSVMSSKAKGLDIDDEGIR